MGAAGAESWGVGEALFYGEVVPSTQTMLERYAFFFFTALLPLLSRPTPLSFSFPHSRHRRLIARNIYTETPDSWRPSKPRLSQSRHFSSPGAAVAPTRGSRQRDACNSPSSYARHCALRGSLGRASSLCSTSLGWPSSARVATSARWVPSGVHACG